MPTHPIDIVFHRLWTLAVGLPSYVKDDWKTVNEAVVAYCYGKRRPILAVVSEISQKDADALRVAMDDLEEALDAVPLEKAPQTAQGSRVLPGEWLCRGCGFKLSKRVLDPRDGAIGVNAVLKREECRNCQTLMDQATEADVIEAMNGCVESWIDALEEAGGVWWHVTRSLPPIGDQVLVVARYEVGAVVAFGQLHSYNDREGKPVTHWTTKDTVGRAEGRVTHWKRLPKVPDEDLGAGPGGTCTVVDSE